MPSAKSLTCQISLEIIVGPPKWFQFHFKLRYLFPIIRHFHLNFLKFKSVILWFFFQFNAFFLKQMMKWTTRYTWGVTQSGATVVKLRLNSKICGRSLVDYLTLYHSSASSRFFTWICSYSTRISLRISFISGVMPSTSTFIPFLRL